MEGPATGGGGVTPCLSRSELHQLYKASYRTFTGLFMYDNNDQELIPATILQRIQSLLATTANTTLGILVMLLFFNLVQAHCDARVKMTGRKFTAADIEAMPQHPDDWFTKAERIRALQEMESRHDRAAAERGSAD